MNLSLMLCCFVLWSTCWTMVNTLILLEDLNDSYQSTTTRLHVQNKTEMPPVVIVELPKTSKKTKKAEIKPKKTKLSGHVKRPPPPPNCAPLWGSCKGNTVCCEHCAFCSCRILRTVCYCRMGYPRC